MKRTTLHSRMKKLKISPPEPWTYAALVLLARGVAVPSLVKEPGAGLFGRRQVCIGSRSDIFEEYGLRFQRGHSMAPIPPLSQPLWFVASRRHSRLLSPCTCPAVFPDSMRQTHCFHHMPSAPRNRR
jgi:hypothetical protein